jgi:hypothetical protein
MDARFGPTAIAVAVESSNASSSVQVTTRSRTEAIAFSADNAHMDSANGMLISAESQLGFRPELALLHRHPTRQPMLRDLEL